MSQNPKAQGKAGASSILVQFEFNAFGVFISQCSIQIEPVPAVQ
jgi:hypothetical protein